MSSRPGHVLIKGVIECSGCSLDLRPKLSMARSSSSAHTQEKRGKERTHTDSQKKKQAEPSGTIRGQAGPRACRGCARVLDEVRQVQGRHLLSAVAFRLKGLLGPVTRVKKKKK